MYQKNTESWPHHTTYNCPFFLGEYYTDPKSKEFVHFNLLYSQQLLQSNKNNDIEEAK